MKDIIKEKLEEFHKKFCNNHQKPIRFLRSIFYDEQDGAEQIETFINQALLEVREKTIRECIEALPEYDYDKEFENWAVIEDAKIDIKNLIK